MNKSREVRNREKIHRDTKEYFLNYKNPVALDPVVYLTNEERKMTKMELIWERMLGGVVNRTNDIWNLLFRAKIIEKPVNDIPPPMKGGEGF